MVPIDSFVTWKWTPPPGYRSSFSAAAVNVLRRMIARHYPAPHRFLYFTDLPSPSGPRKPSCYRRLRAFAPDIGQVFGRRFVSLDLDTVITGDLRPVVDRPEDFVIWGDTNPRTFYNGGLVLMNAGARPQVWTTFNPATSPRASALAGHHGSDQGWISHCLGPHECKWTREDGIYSFRLEVRHTRRLPANARVISFHGEYDPWTADVQSQHPWIREHYR
jgi:hypothetical protein